MVKKNKQPLKANYQSDPKGDLTRRSSVPVNPKRKRSRAIPIPPKEELEALYNGTHPDCNGKPFTQDEIADYYSKKHNRPVSRRTVSNWFHKYNIKTRPYKFKRKIPMPSKEELEALYDGTHPDCNGKPFTQYDIADYYSKKHNRKVSRPIVGIWFKKLGIKSKDSRFKPEILVPSKEELEALYDGTHPDCNGNPFTQDEIADYYSKKLNCPVSQPTVSEWFSTYKIKTRFPFPDMSIIRHAREWECLIYKLADFLLSNETWTTGHGIHKIPTPNISDCGYIEPEIIVFFCTGLIKKFIEAKYSDSNNAIKPKDTDIYPQFALLKLVEFWILFGTSRVEFYYSDGSIEHRSLTDFDEDAFDPSTVDKVLVFINSNDLITQLQQCVTDSTKELIKYLINEIRRLQCGMSDKQTSLEDFLG